VIGVSMNRTIKGGRFTPETANEQLDVGLAEAMIPITFA
jgi:hypothetical protein